MAGPDLSTGREERMAASLEELEKKQRDIKPLVEKLQKAKGDEVVKIAKQIAEKTKELEKSALALAAAATPEGARNVGGPETTVLLTPDQKKRVVEGTGVGLETVVL